MQPAIKPGSTVPNGVPDLDDVRLQLVRAYRVYRYLKGLDPDRFEDRLSIDQIAVAFWRQEAKRYPIPDKDRISEIFKTPFWISRP